MSILQEFENLKYRLALDLIKKEELYDKKKSVINGIEAFNLFYERYKLMQQVLLPLKKKLGNRVEVTDINFVNTEGDEEGIIVRYNKSGKSYLFSISNLDYEDITVLASDSRVQTDAFIEVNRDIILETFRNIDFNDLNKDVILKSTSGRFTIKDNCDTCLIKDTEAKIFSIDNKYSIYEKDNNFNNSIKISCDYPRLKELLEDKENIQLVYNHLQFYEDDITKILIKKVN